MGAPEVEAEASDGEGTGWADAITGLSEAQPAASFCAGGAGEVEGDPRSGVGSEEEEGLERGNAFLLGELHKVGEVLVEVGSTSSSTHGWGPNAIETEEELESCIERLRSVALERGKADISVLRRRTITEDSGAKRKLHLADVEVRRRAGNPLEVRIAVVGNVDSGKSTMVGVLTRSMLDDGRGSARQKILKFSHEAQTGRTSSIGQHNLCISSTGEILNDSTFRQTQCGEVVARSSKLITMVDLAGHEKYFKTTAFGLTGNLPDYAMLIIGANHGLIGMCKEHLGE